MVGGPGADPAEEDLAGKQFAREEASQAHGALTLSTTCACGHTRKDHRGLRMEVAGACLECGCEEFRRARAEPVSHGQVMEEIRAGLNQVEHLQEIVARLCAQLSDDPRC